MAWTTVQPVIAACESWLNTTYSKPHLSSACVAQSAALREATLVTGVRIPPVPFFLFFFFIHPLNSLFGLFSNIKPLTIWFTFFLFSTANLSLDLAVHARTAVHDVWFIIVRTAKGLERLEPTGDQNNLSGVTSARDVLWYARATCSGINFCPQTNLMPDSRGI